MMSEVTIFDYYNGFPTASRSFAKSIWVSESSAVGSSVCFHLCLQAMGVWREVASSSDEEEEPFEMLKLE